MVKETSNISIEYFTCLINLSVNTGIFPDAVKISKVTPIFKKSGQLQTNPYRIDFQYYYREITKTSNIFFSRSQFGFRKNHLTTVLDVVILVFDGLERDNALKLHF